MNNIFMQFVEPKKLKDPYTSFPFYRFSFSSQNTTETSTAAIARTFMTKNAALTFKEKRPQFRLIL